MINETQISFARSKQKGKKTIVRRSCESRKRESKAEGRMRKRARKGQSGRVLAIWQLSPCPLGGPSNSRSPRKGRKLRGRRKSAGWINWICKTRRFARGRGQPTRGVTPRGPRNTIPRLYASCSCPAARISYVPGIAIFLASHRRNLIPRSGGGNDDGERGGTTRRNRESWKEKRRWKRKKEKEREKQGERKKKKRSDSSGIRKGVGCKNGGWYKGRYDPAAFSPHFSLFPSVWLCCTLASRIVKIEYFHERRRAHTGTR